VYLSVKCAVRLEEATVSDLNLNLAAELASVLPDVREEWGFSSGPGWYRSCEDSGYPMFWDGVRWHDPAGDFEKRITDLVVPHLEEVFKLGFIAGMEAAQQPSVAP
jgi:hypothetical protein